MRKRVERYACRDTFGIGEKALMSDLSNMQRTWGYRYFVLSVILNSRICTAIGGAQ